jgi:DNA-binding transcriptional ArsR family regulator
MGGVVVWAGMRGGCQRGHRDRLRLHRYLLRLDGREYTVITPGPGTGVGFSTNRYHDTWHVLSDLRGAQLLARLLWGLAYQRIPGTLVVIGPPLLDPNPFDAEPADPIALVPAVLTPLRAQAARQLRHRLPLGMPAGTVRWHTPGLAPAVTACRGERDRPRGQRPWYPPPGAGHRIDRVGGVLVLAATAQELKSWAVAVAQLGDWLLEGMDYTGLNGTERASGEIAARFAVTRQAISQHLGVLLGCGLVSVRADGTKRLYRANRRPVEQLRAEFDLFWDASLDRLSSAAQQLEGESGDHGR